MVELDVWRHLSGHQLVYALEVRIRKRKCRWDAIAYCANRRSAGFHIWNIIYTTVAGRSGGCDCCIRRLLVERANICYPLELVAIACVASGEGLSSPNFYTKRVCSILARGCGRQSKAWGGAQRSPR